MAKPNRHQIKDALLREYGSTFARELKIPVEGNTPAPLFQLLVASLLFSARISGEIAMSAFRALVEQGWTTPEKMAASTWEERTRTLNRSGYARYDESTSRMLGDTVDILLDRYQGDLRNLREEAARDPGGERRRLKEFKGIGDTGVDIFFREVQVAWDELFPFADKKALQGAERLGLGNDAAQLLDLAGQADFPALIGALVRVQLRGDVERVMEMAADK